MTEVASGCFILVESSNQIFVIRASMVSKNSQFIIKVTQKAQFCSCVPYWKLLVLSGKD